MVAFHKAACRAAKPKTTQTSPLQLPLVLANPGTRCRTRRQNLNKLRRVPPGPARGWCGRGGRHRSTTNLCSRRDLSPRPLLSSPPQLYLLHLLVTNFAHSNNNFTNLATAAITPNEVRTVPAIVTWAEEPAGEQCALTTAYPAFPQAATSAAVTARLPKTIPVRSRD